MKNLKIKYKLGISFLIMLLIPAVISVYAYIVIQNEGEQTHLLYDHPYTVSTAVLRVEANVLSIRTNIRDVPRAETEDEKLQHISEIDSAETLVYKDLGIVKERYLGDKADVETIINLMEEWKPIRDEIISLSLEGTEAASDQALAMTKSGAGGRHYTRISSELQSFIDFADAKAQEFDATAAKAQEESLIILSIILIIAAIIAVFISIYVTRLITVSVKKGVRFAEKIADGNYNATLDIDQKDEMGELAAALESMVASFKRGVAYAEKIAKGDLSNTETQVNANQNPLEKALRLMETRLTEVIANIKTGTESIASGSREISASSSQVASGANEQAASTEEVSASMEEMAANINQSTENARITEKIAAKSAVGIKKGNNSFKITVEAMREIAGKIKMISEIARKTDVLAINAAIEAARAGEHGKGFAVVANEIRKLAENSQEAATVIEDVVGSSVDVAEESDKILSALLPEVERTSALVKEITNAGNEQNSGVNQINNAVQELTKVIQQNTSAADEMASGAKSMAAQARELEKIVAFFKIDELTKNMAEKIDVDESFEEIEDGMSGDENDTDSKDKKGSPINLDDYDDKDDDEFETYK